MATKGYYAGATMYNWRHPKDGRRIVITWSGLGVIVHSALSFLTPESVDSILEQTRDEDDGYWSTWLDVWPEESGEDE